MNPRQWNFNSRSLFESFCCEIQQITVSKYDNRLAGTQKTPVLCICDRWLCFCFQATSLTWVITRAPLLLTTSLPTWLRRGIARTLWSPLTTGSRAEMSHTPSTYYRRSQPLSPRYVIKLLRAVGGGGAKNKCVFNNRGLRQTTPDHSTPDIVLDSL